MSRSVTTATRSEFTADRCRPRFFLEIAGTSAIYHWWTGSQDIYYNTNLYQASSLFKSIDQISVQKGTPEGMNVNLAGEPSEMMALIQNGFTQTKVGRFYLGFVNDSLALIADPVLLFSGRLDSVELVDDVREATITLTFVNELSTLYEENEFRYTHETQQIFMPGDMCFEYMPQLKDLHLFWGIPDKKKPKKPRGERKPRRRGGKK